MLKSFTIWASCFMLFGSKVFGQNLHRLKSIEGTADTLTIDTLSIVPGSVSITYEGNTISRETYKMDAAKSVLIWIEKPGVSPLEIKYQVFPVLFTRRYSNRSAIEVTEGVISNEDFEQQTTFPEKNTLFSLEGLNKSGSISRTVGVGNNQDLALNSNMTLQLAGKITEDLEILAAISDDNIPIQPEGNTQQINDFDKVFIQLKRKNASLTGGDFELRRPDSYFMNFYKRTQGGSFSTQFFSKKGWNYKTSVSAAVAKGRSSRISINGIEGNQGPYRITGSNGEQSIIVLSGTERVFVDGLLAKRGQENDYVIDYNTAEITFTARRLITQNSRIIVEFEYSDKNYARTLSYFNQEISKSRFAIKLNYYNEQDNRNQPFLQEITNEQKGFLQAVGNNINQAYFPNVDTVTFNDNEILYKQIDTLGGTGVYVQSIDPALAKYRLGFSYVGSNNGNYQLKPNSAANGRVFEYVPPVAGNKQGSYEPVTLLITPKKQQLITLGTDYKLSANTLISSEVALSNNDVNLFSDIGNKQNQGFALKLYAKNESRLGKQDSLATRLITSASYERTSSAFKPIERYRPVEFERDFNLHGLPSLKNEHLASVAFSLFKDISKNLNYQFNTFIKENIYTGYQNSLNGSYDWRKYRIRYSGNILNSSSVLNRGSFFRQQADLSRQFKAFIAGINFEQELNRTKQEDGFLALNSFAFDQYKAYLVSNFGSGNSARIEYSKRYDQLPSQSKLLNSSLANIISGEVNLSANPNSVLTITSTYRDVKYAEHIANDNENTLLGRIDYTLSLLKGFVNSNIFYELGPGREPKREFSYLEVITGQGAYTWNDYNQNAIKELNEFEIARFQDQAKYIRIYQNTNEFINTDYTTANYTLRLSPALLWKRKAGFQKFLSLFSSQTAFKTERKTSGVKGFQAYNPFAGVAAVHLISDNTFLRNTLFINRNSPVYGIDLNYQTSGNKLLLINGFDTRNRNEGGVRLRWNIQKTNFVLETKRGIKKYRSELFTEKNYQINFLEFLPEINYQFNNNMRLSFNGSITQQNNQINSKEESTNYKVGSDIRYNILRKGTINSGINLVKNKFKGTPNTSLSFEMLEGLQTGNNIIWTAGLQRTITQGVQLNIGYEGRKSEAVRTIHTGSLQFRAFF
ncbi:hypothetical protein [Desertivirga xinjiangensis]|uniref:hypothetical protein n=1 Tax=Desertivirga xinjiangensis TaxID=539206 RepID=UPI00210C1CDE|nr:hypothetical protein [Pedobacter xinjiangensis]